MRYQYPFPNLRIPSDLGDLEIWPFCQRAWRNLAPKSVCQSKIADDYTTQAPGPEEADADAGPKNRNCPPDICKAIFRKLQRMTVFQHPTVRTLKATTIAARRPCWMPITMMPR